MKKVKIVLLLGLLCVCAGGCEEFLAGAGAGLATQETLESWQENLVIKQEELKARYDAVMKEIQDAPDPNALALAKKKLEPIQNAQLANEAALHTVRTIITAKEQSGQGRQDALAVGAVGLAGIFLEGYRKRVLNKKYVSMKAGQARLKVTDPQAEEKLYAIIGEERRARGL